jgi:ligand-binding sensor domain-containing protein
VRIRLILLHPVSNALNDLPSNKISLHPSALIGAESSLMNVNYRIVFLLLSSFFLSFTAIAQQSGNIALGEWREHLPFSRGSSVAQSNEFVYCATTNGIVILKKDEGSIERLSRSNGLSDINLNCLNFHEGTNTLVVGYKNGNLDLVRNNEVMNVGDIKRSTVVQGGKTINAIRFIDDRAYLCCNFGIVVYDLTKREVRTTLYPSLLNPDVFDIATDGTRIFAATSKGLYSADLSNPALPYYVAWTQDTLLKSRSVNNLTWFDGGIFASSHIDNTVDQDTVFQVKNGAMSIFRSGETYNSISSREERMAITTNYGITLVDSGSLFIENVLSYENGLLPPSPLDAIIDRVDVKRVWIADKNLCLVKSQNVFINAAFSVPGPPSSNVFRMKSSNGNVWVAPGAWDVAYSPLYLIDGVFRFDGLNWDAFKLNSGTDFVRDIVSLAIDPADNEHLYVASWGGGVAELQNGAIVQRFGALNSGLVGIANYPDDIRVSDVATDPDGNLWVVCSSSAKPLAVKTPGGEWKNFAFSSSVNSQFLGNMLIDSSGLKWVIVQERGILVANTEGTTLKGYKFLNDQAGNGALASNTVFCMTQDLDGQIWVGTSKGISVFYTPESIFQQGATNWDSQTIVIGQDGFNQYLLKEEEVTAIAVDGANRKWIGTRKAGIFVVSPDGTEQLAQYTTENSPLLSNTVSSLSINGETGEIFIGTDVGICSYRTDASRGGDVFGHVYTFPNPVEHGYEGPIAITGLVTDANVKITDVSGNLVFSTVANGGTAVWNGKLFSGERASTGVYLVFCSNDDGSQTKVTKFLFIH